MKWRSFKMLFHSFMRVTSMKYAFTWENTIKTGLNRNGFIILNMRTVFIMVLILQCMTIAIEIEKDFFSNPKNHNANSKIFFSFIRQRFRSDSIYFLCVFSSKKKKPIKYTIKCWISIDDPFNCIIFQLFRIIEGFFFRGFFTSFLYFMLCHWTLLSFS